MSLLDNKRKQSLHEYTATDLSHETIGEMHLWYDQIIDLINKNPPKYYVKGITIQENMDGKIKTIFYNYADKPTTSLSITVISI